MANTPQAICPLEKMVCVISLIRTHDPISVFNDFWVLGVITGSSGAPPLWTGTWKRQQNRHILMEIYRMDTAHADEL